MQRGMGDYSETFIEDKTLFLIYIQTFAIWITFDATKIHITNVCSFMLSYAPNALHLMIINSVMLSLDVIVS